MFHKLRNRFTLLNMLITSIVILAAFASVILATYQSAYKDNLNKLRMQSGSHFVITQDRMQNPPEGNAFGETTAVVTTDFALSFTVIADGDGNIQHVRSIIDMPDTAYETALQTAWNSGKDEGTLMLMDKRWMYQISRMPQLVTPVPNGFMISESELFSVVFMDVTESYNTLFGLIQTLAIASIALLAAVYCISRLFANRAIRPLQESWEKQKQFVADASHELKTPLSIITANCDALESDDTAPTQGQEKWLNNIHAGVDRMSSLVGELLALSQAEEQTEAVCKQPFDLCACVQRAADLAQAAFEERDITLALHIEPDVTVKSDEDRIGRIVQILLDNAAKYTDEGGQVTVKLQNCKNDAVVAVENTGAGIASEELTKVFDRFYRIDKARTSGQGGHGLGLSIARALSVHIGAELTAHSDENALTTFTLTIPVEPA